MSANTSIEWTDRSWNPVRGCSLVSDGCRSCYAMKQAHRFSGAGQPYEGLTELGPAGPRWTGKIRTVDEALAEPLRWRKPQRIFVNSMSDLFHEDVPDAFIDRVFAMMALCRRHIFQILTKRPERMLAYLSSKHRRLQIEMVGEAIKPSRPPEHWYHVSDWSARLNTWPLPNVWLGVSCENQETADTRIPILLQTPAAVRFISAEPLLGPIDLKNVASAPDEMMLPLAGLTWGLDMRLRRTHARLDWVIVGGESGPKGAAMRVGLDRVDRLAVCVGQRGVLR